MSKIFRFSGYFVDTDLEPFSKDSFEVNLKEGISGCCEPDSKGIFQQLHIEVSEEFESDGELDENCDLALLTRHFKREVKAEYDRPLPEKGQVYKHFKLGKLVTIIGISRHTETEELSVVYDYEGSIWSRPLDMFMSEVDKVKYPDVKEKYRFTLVE